jgi:acyl carrier protein
MADELHSKLVEVFSKTLRVDGALITDELAYAAIPQWDSVAHMALITAIEDAFDIAIDTDDVIDMSSFAKARIIVKKYQ